MSGGGGGGQTQTITKSDPWSGIQPHLGHLYNSAGNWFNTAPMQYYPGTTVAELNPYTHESLRKGWGRAAGGSPLNQAAQQLTNSFMHGGGFTTNPIVNRLYMNENDTAMGKFLGEGNPYLKGMFQDASSAVTDEFKNAVMPSLASQFSMAGRTGSGSHVAAAESKMGTLGRTLSGLSSNIYGQAYENERGRMANAYENEAARRASAFEAERQRSMQAAGMASHLAQQDYLDIEKMFGIGEYWRNDRQEHLDADRQRHDYNRDAWMNKLQIYNQLLQGGMNFSSTDSSSMQKAARMNPFAAAGGGALAGAAVGAQMGAGAGPWGALIGAGLGLLAR